MNSSSTAALPVPGCAVRSCAVHPVREIEAERAYALYAKLRDVLRVRRPSGCYLPGGADHGAGCNIPLHAWRGPGDFPLAVQWDPTDDMSPRPTFAQFCAVYGLVPAISEDLIRRPS